MKNEKGPVNVFVFAHDLPGPELEMRLQLLPAGWPGVCPLVLVVVVADASVAALE